MSKTEMPSIRFYGFDDAWEQRKLGEVATFINGRAYSQPELLSSGKYKVLRVGNFYTNDSWYYSDLELGEKYYADYGDLLYTWSATFGPHIWLGDRAIYHYHIWKINLSDQLEKQFAVQLLEQDRANILSSKNGSTMVHITKEGMEQKDVIIPPSTKEQQEIGAFFLQLDNLITLHQRKFEKLTNVKKSMLEKMFPQNGSSYPEIRFKGFTDPWEQRKLGDDLVSIHTGTNLLGSITNTGMPLIKMGNIQRGYFDTSKVEFLAENEQPDKADIANYGDFFFNARNTLELVGKGATWMKNSGEYAFNSNIARFELRNLDTIFFNYLYNTDYMTKQIHARAMGTTSVAAIYPRTLDSVEYLAPCMKEQQKIGAYFKQLDNLITLHQRELEKLQSIKKALLKKMFV